MGCINLNIFKVEEFFSYEELKILLKEKFKVGNNDVLTKEKIETIGNDTYKVCALYVREEFDGKDTLWENKMQEVFGLSSDVVKKVYSSYGALIILYKEKIYIISFGKSNGKIAEFIDPDFGLDMASKMLSEETIKVQSSKFFALDKNKSIVEFSKTRFIGTIGESFEGLVGDLEEYTGRNAINQLELFINKKAKFTTSVFLNIKEEFFDLEHICLIILNLEQIERNYEIRIEIPRLKRVKERENNLLNKLDEKLNEKIITKDFNDGNITIPFYKIENSKFIFLENIVSFKLMNGRKVLNEYEELTIEHIAECMEKEEIKDIKSLKVKTTSSDGIENEAVSILDLLEFTLQLDGDESYYSLSRGVWNRYNEKYLEIINQNINKMEKIVEFNSNFDYDSRKVKEFISKNQTEFNEIMKKNPYREIQYNFKLSKETNSVLCDRKTPHGIEVCDLYMNNNELVHVKFGGPSNFIECIDQSKKGIDLYCRNITSVKETLGIGDAKIATLILLTDNKSVIENNGDISKFNSLRFKINLLEWYEKIKSYKFDGKIIIAREK